jgi:hypothetical protein
LIRDLRLTVLARRALQNDRELSRLNLGVRVTDGVATVWGPVPSDAVARQAVAKVRSVNGIYDVRSELQYRRPAQRPLLADIGIPPRVPTRIEVAKPDTDTGAIRSRPRDQTVMVGDRKGVRPTDLPPLKALPMPSEPSTTARPAPATPAEKADRTPPVPLSVAVQRVKMSSSRFRSIPVELRGDVVVIGRSGADDEDVTALAQALRRVRGVSEVVVASD